MSSAFRPLLARDADPSESKRAKSPAPFCRELRLSGAQSKMQWKKTTIGDTTVPSKQPTIHRREPDPTSRAQAKTARRLRRGNNFLHTKDPPAPARQFHRRSSKTGP